MHQINISFVLTKEGAVLELCTSAHSEGKWDVTRSVHETILFSRPFALPGGRSVRLKCGADIGGGPGLALAGSPGPGPLPLLTEDASDRGFTRDSFPSPSPYHSCTATRSLLFVLCFYLHAFTFLLISLLILLHGCCSQLSPASLFHLFFSQFSFYHHFSMFLTCHMASP